MELRKYEKLNEQVYFGTLPNGLAIYVMPKKGYFKSTAAFATNYGGSDMRFKLSGSWHDTPAGVAHFLEHKMFDMEGGGNALSLLSANGASPNAFTSSGMTAYHFESTENFEENLRILLKFVSKPYFTDESVNKEQGIIGQEIRMTEDNPDYAVYQNLMKALYAENPIRVSVAGTVESIANITAQTLYYCHEAFYNPSNMVLCAAGDLEPERIEAIAREILPAEKKETAERDYGKKEEAKPFSALSDVKMEVALPMFIAGIKLDVAEKGPERQRRELLGDFALNLLFGKSSPLYARLYSEGLIDASFSGGTTFFPGGAAVIFGGESKNPSAVCSAVLDEAKTLASKGPNDALFRRLKKAALGDEIRSLNSLYGMCISRATGHFGGYDPLVGIEQIGSFSIGDVNEFIAESLKPENLALSVVRPMRGE